MFVPYTHESIRLTGRWDRSDSCATATATGSYIEFCFEGTLAVARFDIDTNLHPLLHLWIEIDGGDRVEAPIDYFLRIQTKTSGRHVCRIIYKGGTELARRWYAPLQGKVSFLGVQADCPLPIPADNRPIIEFVGDSITEGVLIDVDFAEGGQRPFELETLCQPHLDDVCATYAWLSAERLNLRPIFMGYGAVGVTRPGQARVPAAPLSYPFNFDGSPITYEKGDFVLINHGANDRGATPERYIADYKALLDVIRHRNPTAKIVALSAFCGGHRDALERCIKEYNEENGTDVQFVNGSDWIPPEPLHPLRDGHETVARQLVPILKELFAL